MRFECEERAITRGTKKRYRDLSTPARDDVVLEWSYGDVSGSGRTMMLVGVVVR
jgi:hypothetical protein